MLQHLSINILYPSVETFRDSLQQVLYSGDNGEESENEDYSGVYPRNTRSPWNIAGGVRQKSGDGLQHREPVGERQEPSQKHSYY
jgi:hypothetical protein